MLHKQSWGREDMTCLKDNGTLRLVETVHVVHERNIARRLERLHGRNERGKKRRLCFFVMRFTRDPTSLIGGSNGGQPAKLRKAGLQSEKGKAPGSVTGDMVFGGQTAPRTRDVE
jgi:hypothetical protein